MLNRYLVSRESVPSMANNGGYDVGPCVVFFVNNYCEYIIRSGVQNKKVATFVEA